MSDPTIPPPPVQPYQQQAPTVIIQQKKGGCFRWVGIAAVVFVALVVILAVAGASNKNKTSHPITPTASSGVTGAASSSSSGDVGMTKAKYDAVQPGMTPAQVDAIVQPANCEQLSQSEIAGHTGYSYDCKDDVGIGNAFFVFYDGVVTSKSQFGLD